MTVDNDESQSGFDPVMGSAHPPIALLSPELTGETLGTLYKLSRSEVAVYEIIQTDTHFDEAAPAASETTTIDMSFRPDPDSPARGAILRFQGRTSRPGSWLDLAPDHADVQDGPCVNSAEAVVDFMLALDAGEDVGLTYAASEVLQEDTIDLVQLMHLMEGAGIGRPSTYHTVLKAALDDYALLSIDPEGGHINLTEAGRRTSELLEQHSGGIGSVEFNQAFATHLDAMAAGETGSQDFLVWVAKALGYDLDREEIWDGIDAIASGALVSPSSIKQPRGGVIDATGLSTQSE